MTLRRQSAVGARETRTQGGLVAPPDGLWRCIPRTTTHPAGTLAHLYKVTRGQSMSAAAFNYAVYPRRPHLHQQLGFTTGICQSTPLQELTKRNGPPHFDHIDMVVGRHF